MQFSILIALIALFVAFSALIVAVLDWLQIGREEAWQAHKVSETRWALERRQNWPVWILDLSNFGSAPVTVVHPAAHPGWPLGQGDKLLLEIDPSTAGTLLAVYFKRLTLLEIIRHKLYWWCISKVDYENGTEKNGVLRPKGDRFRRIGERIQIAGNPHFRTGSLKGPRVWSIPIY